MIKRFAGLTGWILSGSLAALVVAGLAYAENPFSAAFPDPERFAEDIAAFEAADAANPAPQDATLCIGSSSMRMWHPNLARDLAPLTVIPRGFGGSTMYDVLHYAPRIVLPGRPRTILLYEGDNDIDFGVTPAAFMATFQAFVALVARELPATRIFVISIKPSGLRWAKWPAMREANDLLRAACETNPSLTYIDVAPHLLGEDGLPDDGLFLEDRLHLNEEGYAVWSRVVAGVLVAKR
jgi:lysophospholipase L1-like esterase